mmetsp:Transcript_26811/g.54192  ORF Transcript_26811/g.54192 Transcript_26811/m.54192 type:complete len:99 (+) Transcript_26811:3475-3771(+)
MNTGAFVAVVGVKVSVGLGDDVGDTGFVEGDNVGAISVGIKVEVGGLMIGEEVVGAIVMGAALVGVSVSASVGPKVGVIVGTFVGLEVVGKVTGLFVG